jgi:glutamine amidotransferase
MLDKSKLLEKPLLPHMGWNNIEIIRSNDIFKNVELEKGFYFLHSFYFDCENESDILCRSNYGLNFPSGVKSGNVYGIQFHPEKSHSNGVAIFENFAKL